MALLLAVAMLPNAAMGEDSVVLVTSESCPISDISSLDTRKVYLGVAVSQDGRNIRPFRMSGDPKLSQVFYQSIVAMSKKSYERRVLSLALKFGTPRPAEYSSVDDAVAAVRRIECSIVYLWYEDFVEYDGIKMIRVLWQSS